MNKNLEAIFTQHSLVSIEQSLESTEIYIFFVNKLAEETGRNRENVCILNTIHRHSFLYTNLGSKAERFRVNLKTRDSQIK